MADGILADVEASGIYQIRNLVNGKRYVGSAKCFRIRWNAHRMHLNRGSHHSRHLQSSWKKYGPDAFAFEAVEVVSPASLIAREQAWIDAAIPEYNVCPNAGSTLGKLHSNETRAKIAARKLGLKLPPRSAEFRAKMSAIHKGRPKSPEQIAKIRETKRLNPQIFTAERIAKLSETTKGQYASGARSRQRSPEYRAKIAATLRGRKPTDEARRNQSLAQIGLLKGRKYNFTEESLRKRARFSDSEVMDIFAMKIAGTSNDSIAKKLGSTRTCVERVLRRETHRFVVIDPSVVEAAQTARANPWENQGFKERMRTVHRTRHAKFKEAGKRQRVSLDPMGLRSASIKKRWADPAFRERMISVRKASSSTDAGKARMQAMRNAKRSSRERKYEQLSLQGV